MSWRDLSSWWLDELAADPSYEEVVTPLLFEVFHPEQGETYVELGSGEGRVMRAVAARGASCLGVELSEDLARRSGARAVVAEVPPIPLRDDGVDGVLVVLALEHIPGLDAVMAEAARVTRPGGVLATVGNHPVWTAPRSTPITDDGEVLWRPGDYFSDGSSEIPAGEGAVTFHHRTMAALLNSAAGAGWSLEHMVERPHHQLAGQAGIPRLLACRWRLEE